MVGGTDPGLAGVVAGCDGAGSHDGIWVQVSVCIQKHETVCFVLQPIDINSLTSPLSLFHLPTFFSKFKTLQNFSILSFTRNFSNWFPHLQEMRCRMKGHSFCCSEVQLQGWAVTSVIVMLSYLFHAKVIAELGNQELEQQLLDFQDTWSERLRPLIVALWECFESNLKILSYSWPWRPPNNWFWHIFSAFLITVIVLSDTNKISILLCKGK